MDEKLTDFCLWRVTTGKEYLYMNKFERHSPWYWDEEEYSCYSKRRPARKNLDMNPKPKIENKTMTWEAFMESSRHLSKKRKQDLYSASTTQHADSAQGEDKVIKRAIQSLFTMDQLDCKSRLLEHMIC